MTGEAIWDWVLGWLVRLAGLFWVLGGFMLFRQIRMEMALDRMTSQLERAVRDFEAEPGPAMPPEDSYGDIDAPVQRRVKSEAEASADRWMDRDDAARRGWIAGQAVVLLITGLAMMLLHQLASAFVALLVLGQGVYFIWREATARRAPSADAAAHARPSPATINAGWVSLAVGCFVWLAAFRGVLR
ncbi:MAG: hypothetical protein QM773_02055 [Hyphomonadaceae bacterium]